VIQRSWHGAVPNEHGDAFDRHFRDHVLGGIAATPGNLGVFVKRHGEGRFDHFFLISYWEGWDAIRAFAGATPHLAVHYPDDARFGVIADPIVLHQRCEAIEPWYMASSRSRKFLCRGTPRWMSTCRIFA
jgi:heme-degrading monooxygenase HmoA